METLSYIGAAQRLGISAEEVKKLVKEKKLKEIEPGRVKKASVYAYSGISTSGNQTKKAQKRKPAVMAIEAAADYLGVSIAKVKKLVEAGNLEIVEGAKGVRGVREAMVKMYKKKMDDREERVAPVKEKEEKTNDDKKSSEDKNETEPAEPAVADEAVQQSAADDAAGDPSCAEEDEVERIDRSEIEAFMEMLLPVPEKRAETYTECDMREIAEAAFRRGKLAVYESMQKFERR